MVLSSMKRGSSPVRICCLLERGETMHPRLGNNFGLRRMNKISGVIQGQHWAVKSNNKRERRERVCE